MTETVPRRPLIRMTAFRTGILSAVVTWALLAALFRLAFGWVAEMPPYNVEVLANGADVSRHGGSQLFIENDTDGWLVSANCSGACDDLGYRRKTREDEDIEYRVRVLDVRGACVACGEYWYVQTPVGGNPGLTQWRVAGQVKLKVDPERRAARAQRYD